MLGIVNRLDERLFGTLDERIERSFAGRRFNAIKSFLAPAEERFTAPNSRDLMIGLLLGLLAETIAWWAMHQFPERLYCGRRL